MSEQEIVKGNKLIAEFIGLEKNDFGYWINKDYLFNSQLKLLDFELKFHSSWDWLMPVVEKIENTKPFYSVSNNAGFWYNDETDTVDRNKLQYLCIISDKSYRIIINSANYFPERDNKLVATWFAVVEFIKWYNSCQKEK